MNTDIDNIVLRLQNAGFHGVQLQGDTIIMEDPSCVVRSFENFFEYAWLAVTILSLFLLTGWAITLIRGGKYDKTFTNLRNLTILFCCLSLLRPVLTFIYGRDLFGSQCKTISVSVEEVLEIQARNKNNHGDELFETINIEDTGIILNETSENTDEDAENTPQMSDEQIIGAFENLIKTTEAYAREEQNTTSGTSSSTVNSGSGGTASDSHVNYLSAADTSENNETVNETVNPDNNSGIIVNDINVNPVGINVAIDTQTPVSARRIGNAVIYTMADGTQVKRSGGTRAWRNFNPGNIIYGSFTRNAGAIGKDDKGFAIFPSESIGMRAIDSLLRTSSYYYLTIRNAISRYAPPSENNTAAYHKTLARYTGLDIDKKLVDLTNDEMQRVVNAIRRIEGWDPGTIERI